jgi:hypothetical protein
MWDALERCRLEVAGIAARALRAARGERDLAALVAAVEAIVARELDGGRAAGSPPPACGPGCAACCRVNVATLAIEGAAIAAFVRERLGAAHAAALAERLTEFHGRVRWLEDRERIAGGAACPLLDARDGCTVHPVRPLACRSVSSLDADDCRRAMAACDEDGEPVVRMGLLQRALYAEAITAIAQALADAGLDARCRDVSGMTALFLADPELAPAFLAGGRLPVE